MNLIPQPLSPATSSEQRFLLHAVDWPTYEKFLDAVADRIQGIKAGADDFLTKPVHEEELFARIATALKLKHTVDRRIGELRAIKDHVAGLRSVAFDAAGKRFVSSDESGIVKVFDAATLDLIVSFKASSNGVYRAKFTPDGTSIVTARITARTP